MLVIFQASSAPVHDIETQLRAQEELTSYKSLPSYAITVNKIKQEYSNTLSKVSHLFSNFSCATCRYAVSFLKDMFDNRMSYDAIADAIGEICYLANVQDKNVCKGVVQVFKVCDCVGWLNIGMGGREGGGYCCRDLVAIRVTCIALNRS